VRRAPVLPAPALVLGAIASVQIGAAIATRLFPDIGPAGTVFLRLALSALLVGALARPRLAGRRRADLGVALAYGTTLAAMNATFYEALDRIPLGVAVTVEFVGPLGVAIWGSRRARDVLWAVLAAAGVVLLTSGGSGSLDLAGVGLAAVAGVFWAAYILLAQRVGAAFPGATGLAVALIVGTVVVAPFGLVAAGGRLLHPGILGRGAGVALLSSAVPYSLELFALRRMRAAVFGVLMSVEPAMAAMSGLVFLGQHLHLREWVAVGAVMVASVGATFGARAAMPAEAVPLEPGATPVSEVRA
jgi:inner membrane transporter RhtA